MKPLLLVFKLDRIAKNAYWDDYYELPLPDGCAALAVSGGMPDVWVRREAKLSKLDDKDVYYPLSPFLQSAPGIVATQLIWSLTGPGGRFYPVFRTSITSLKLSGHDPSILPDAQSDVLASLKLQSIEEAIKVDWAGDFMTCFSGGLGLGFYGETTKLEKKLINAKTFTPFRITNEYQLESIDQKIEETHPFLYAGWQEYGLEWLLQNSSLVVRPYGWEGEDIIILSALMSFDDMIQAIYTNLGNEFQILQYDSSEVYLKWASWPWPLDPYKKDDPWYSI